MTLPPNLAYDPEEGKGERATEVPPGPDQGRRLALYRGVLRGTERGSTV